MGGLGLSEPCSQKFAGGSPLFAEFLKFYGAVAASAETPVASLPSPPVTVGVSGDVTLLQTLRPKHFQGFTPSFRIPKTFWGRFRLYHPARFRPTSRGCIRG